MLLVILGWLVVVIFVGMAIYGHVKDEEGFQVAGWIVGIVIGLLMLITSIAYPLVNQGRLQEMRAFEGANAQNYQVAATRSELILSEQRFIERALIPVEGSIEKMDVGARTVGLLIEWRDEVVRYNDDLARFRYFDGHLLVGFYYPDPGDLRFIVIE